MLLCLCQCYSRLIVLDNLIFNIIGNSSNRKKDSLFVNDIITFNIDKQIILIIIEYDLILKYNCIIVE